MSEAKDGASKDDKVVVSLEWEPEALARVKQAAAMTRVTLEHFVRKAAEASATHVIKNRKGLMDLNAAAEFLGVSRSDVVKLISDGKLKAKRIDDEWMVEEASARNVHQEAGTDDLDMIQLDLEVLVDQADLQALVTEGSIKPELSATWTYVTQDGILHCPKAAWQRLGRERVVSDARDAVRRYLKRDK